MDQHTSTPQSALAQAAAASAQVGYTLCGHAHIARIVLSLCLLAYLATQGHC